MSKTMLLIMTLAMGLALVASTGQAKLDPPWITFSPYAGTTLWDDDLFLKDKVLFGGRAGIMFLPWLGIEGTYGLSPAETDFSPGFDVDMQHLGADLVLNFYPNGPVSTYLTGGWTELKFDSDDSNTSLTAGPQYFQGWEFGGGMKIRLSQTANTRLDLRLDARDAYVDLTPAFTDPDDMRHNWLFSGGFQLTFGRSSRDTDGDGVKDRSDDCPDTPWGAVVDRIGCPIDSDGDGVYDGIDVCADTPAGVVVDKAGCPVDSDGDGVYDGLDKCSDTPRRAIVDEDGCPSDSDKDGVPDGVDQCPDTPSHLKVDKDGCAIEITEMETELLDTGMIRTSKILFEVNKADLKPESHPVMDEIGKTLSNWRDLRIEIGGHTDSQGSEEYNLRLSKQRAQKVLYYLTANFPMIRVGQFTVTGYGETQPVATNATKEGRAQNRRVEFKVLNTDELQRLIEKQRLLERN